MATALSSVPSAMQRGFPQVRRLTQATEMHRQRWKNATAVGWYFTAEVSHMASHNKGVFRVYVVKCKGEGYAQHIQSGQQRRRFQGEVLILSLTGTQCTDSDSDGNTMHPRQVPLPGLPRSIHCIPSSHPADTSDYMDASCNSAPEGDLPDLHCPTACCGRAFHRLCLLEWLRGLDDSVLAFGTLFGKCPYCSGAVCVKL